METTLKPGFQRIIKSSVRGDRNVAFTPTSSSANPGETLYIKIPRIDPGLCIVPYSMSLVFNIENSNTKSWLLNNFSRLLISQLQVKIGSQVVYNNTDESTLELYRDVWLPEVTRQTMYEYGIANENTRKLMSGDDSGSTSASAEGVTDKTISDSFKKFRIRVGKILDDHGLFAPHYLNFDITYIVKLTNSNQVMKAQTS